MTDMPFFGPKIILGGLKKTPNFLLSWICGIFSIFSTCMLSQICLLCSNEGPLALYTGPSKVDCDLIDGQKTEIIVVRIARVCCPTTIHHPNAKDISSAGIQPAFDFRQVSITEKVTLRKVSRQGVIGTGSLRFGPSRKGGILQPTTAVFIAQGKMKLSCSRTHF